MKNINACLTSNSIHWGTPKIYYDQLMDKGFIDPCPLNCSKDNLQNEYYLKKLYINPPFCDLDKWTDFIIRQVNENGCEVLLLMPSRTDTKYFRKLSKLCPSIIFLTKRVRFNDSKPAPFPSMLLWFNSRTSFAIYYVMSFEEFLRWL